MNNLTELLKVQLDINKTNADLIDSLKEQINTLFGLVEKMTIEIEDNYAEIDSLTSEVESNYNEINSLRKKLNELISDFWDFSN